MEKPIYLMPVGAVDKGLLEAIARAVGRTFDRPCRVGERLVDPAYAYDRRRRQYRGGRSFCICGGWICPKLIGC